MGPAFPPAAVKLRVIVRWADRMTRATRLAVAAIAALSPLATTAAQARDSARAGGSALHARAARAPHAVSGKRARRSSARQGAGCHTPATGAHRRARRRSAGVAHRDRSPHCVLARRITQAKNKIRYLPAFQPPDTSARSASGRGGGLPGGALDDEAAPSAPGAEAGAELGSEAGAELRSEAGAGGSGSAVGGGGSTPGVSGEGGSASGGGASEGSSGAGTGSASEGSSSAGTGSAGEGSSGAGTGPAPEGAEDPASESGEPAAAQPPTPFRFFAASSFWNTALPADAPLDSTSSAVVAALDQEVTEELAANVGPWINTTKYSVPIYTVPANQPTVAVQLVDHAPEPALSAAWSAVPLPAGALPAKGTDGTLALWQPSSDRLWEFHRLVHEAGVWRASWGGAMQNASSSQGVYGASSWPGAEPWWGASASSLSLLGGLITLEDLQLGQIDHALDLAVPSVRSGAYSLPAQRDDGKSSDPLALPEGAHLRLNPNLDLASLHLPPLTLMLARAAQRYGIMVSDYSSIVELYAQDPTPTGTEPYKGTGGYFEGKYPNQLLASFPWSQLQLLKLELHKS